ncbi:hypothetical protein [Pedobacter sp. MC2016-24]|uniref:hypothetical protein n=1 Tax=Pedobacter sp. MC2016-24 TaxID=2780090 RepID=UPI0018819B07|nr:hypothetical protein [Pedobacter sp. MC2016-24]MBE9599482.1 hypothetical protein [Pedobacter sp. MC2016-24]
MLGLFSVFSVLTILNRIITISIILINIIHEPITTQTNDSGTTTKVYGPNEEVAKEYNKRHTPVNERDDHMHDYKPKPNPNNPDAREKQGGRKPKPDELENDKKRQEKREI